MIKAEKRLKDGYYWLKKEDGAKWLISQIYTTPVATEPLIVVSKKTVTLAGFRKRFVNAKFVRIDEPNE